MIWDLLIAPWQDHDFMTRAFVASMATGLAAAPLGYFLMIRRMALVGDALSHAVLPGAALGFLLGGGSVLMMTLGGILAGWTIAAVSLFVTVQGRGKEDSSFASFYLISLALGVLLLSARGSSADLMHFLFGQLLTVDAMAVKAIVVVSIAACALTWMASRPLLEQAIDSEYLQILGKRPRSLDMAFMALVVLALVTGFQSLGTLLAIGLLVIPASTARLVSQKMPWGLALSMGLAAFASLAGLLIAFHGDFAPGPAIICSAGAIYIMVLLTTLFRKRFSRGHYRPGESSR